MLVLGIESSATAASAAVVEGEKLLGQYYCNVSMTHSQTLLPMAESLLQALGKSWQDFSLLAVSAGPGSFTGVRIGVSCVKGLAFPNNTPCCGVSTLEAIAMPGRYYDGALVCAVMDARCGQVYQALFRAEAGELHRLTPDRALSVAELSEEYRKYGSDLILFGDGAALCHEAFREWGARIAPPELRFQHASSVALAAMKQLTKGNTIAAQELAPAYLRLPQAERELKKKQEKGENAL